MTHARCQHFAVSDDAELEWGSLEVTANSGSHDATTLNRKRDAYRNEAGG